ncbi:hypothetical protein ASD15_14340 [Massilia sp. Root351]|uniref:hypothetical protein n=1 Tax=Massilia sp. Root351 TaxID=1736522 RepID=UPI000708F527|nr:hypothetical protein [Massilia sp. Root351]KQV81130.1 hypothetical protein ASD15_14340 [Massilia sp. Root351]
MEEIDPSQTFDGLPLTVEQDAAIRHYILQCRRNRRPIDAKELTAMLKDMLDPPADGEPDDFFTHAVEHVVAAERAAASVDEAMNPIEACEERNAAMESEAMKGS